MKSLFNRVVNPLGSFIKKRFQHRCFPVEFKKILRTSNLKSAMWRPASETCSFTRTALFNNLHIWLKLISIPEKLDPGPGARDPGPISGIWDPGPSTLDPSPGTWDPGPIDSTWDPPILTLYLEPGTYIWEPGPNTFTWNAGTILRNLYIDTALS